MSGATASWLQMFTTPSALSLAAAQGIAITETTVGDFDGALVETLSRLDEEGANPEVLEALLTDAVALRALINGERPLNGDATELLTRMAQNLAEARAASPTPRQTSFAASVDKVLDPGNGVGKNGHRANGHSQILGYINDAFAVIDERLNHLGYTIERLDTRVARLGRDYEARLRDRGAAGRFYGVSPRALRREHAQGRDQLASSQTLRGDLINLRRLLMNLQDGITTSQGIDLWRIVQGLLADETLANLAVERRRVVSPLIEALTKIERDLGLSEVKDDPELPLEDFELLSPSDLGNHWTGAAPLQDAYFLGAHQWWEDPAYPTD